MHRVYLKPGRDRPVLNGHPWIFSGALQRTEGNDAAVGVADIFDCKEHWIARGLYHANSQIRVRVLTWQKESIDRVFFSRRFSQALALRQKVLAAKTSAYRLINGEGDFLPGLIVDRYGDYFVCQFFTSGMEIFKDDIVECLSGLVSGRGIFERSEGRVRDEEGLAPSIGVLAGEPPPDSIAIEENGFKFLVEVRRGQKTGFFLDQRDSRAYLATVARNQSVLDCFSYSGGFSVYAFGGGAKHVVTFDSSRAALEAAEQNLTLNGFAGDCTEVIKGDAFAYLKECNTTYDIIILDPPSLAHKRSDVEAAAGGYKFLNLHALKHLNPGGWLLTFSCSQHFSTELFQKVVFGAAVDAGRHATVVKRIGHGADHPVSLHHPEGEYLKGLVLRVLD